MYFLKTFVCTLSLFAFLFLSCSNDEKKDGGSNNENEEPVDNEIVNMLKECSTVKTVQSWKATTLAEGVTYLKAQVVKASERPATMYVVKMDANAPGAALKTGCRVPAAGETFPYTMSYPIDIAKMFDTNDEQVTAVIGGDFFRWLDSQLENPQPIDYGCRGPVHHRGKVLQDHFVPETTFPHQALSFLAVDKNGKVIIADAAEYAGMKQNLQECTGGGYRILRDGKICKGFDITLNGNYNALEDKYPFSSIGYRTDGTVIMMIVDGRTDVSMGLTYAEAGDLMKSMGCINSVMLDGGGSAQIVTKGQKTENFVLQNKATDGGQRQMRTFWMITVKK